MTSNEVQSHRQEKPIRKLEAWGVLVAAAVGAFSVGFIPTAAKATPTPTPTPEPAPYCSTWKLRGTTGEWPEIVFGDKPSGAKIDNANRVTLTKSTGGVMPGVEFATYDATISSLVDKELTVEYELVGGASHTSGAVRMFYYTEQNADTILDAPNNKAVATEQSGTLTISGVSEIGTLGFTYDGSNTAEGSVIFRNLKFGDMPIKFRKAGCPSPSPEETATPTPDVTTPAPSNSASVPASPSRTPVAAGADSPTLPITGSNMTLITGIGVTVIVAGSILFVAFRSRRVTVEAPSDDL